MANLNEVEQAIIGIFKKKGKRPGEVIRFMQIWDLGYSAEQANEAAQSIIANGWMEKQGSFLKLMQRDGNPSLHEPALTVPETERLDCLFREPSLPQVRVIIL